MPTCEPNGKLTLIRVPSASSRMAPFTRSLWGPRRLFGCLRVLGVSSLVAACAAASAATSKPEVAEKKQDDRHRRQ
jgi:hypothetical protein